MCLHVIMLLLGALFLAQCIHKVNILYFTIVPIKYTVHSGSGVCHSVYIDLYV